MVPYFKVFLISNSVFAENHVGLAIMFLVLKRITSFLIPSFECMWPRVPWLQPFSKSYRPLSVALLRMRSLLCSWLQSIVTAHIVPWHPIAGWLLSCDTTKSYQLEPEGLQTSHRMWHQGHVISFSWVFSAVQCIFHLLYWNILQSCLFHWMWCYGMKHIFICEIHHAHMCALKLR